MKSCMHKIRARQFRQLSVWQLMLSTRVRHWYCTTAYKQYYYTGKSHKIMISEEKICSSSFILIMKKIFLLWTSLRYSKQFSLPNILLWCVIQSWVCSLEGLRNQCVHTGYLKFFGTQTKPNIKTCKSRPMSQCLALISISVTFILKFLQQTSISNPSALKHMVKPGQEKPHQKTAAKEIFDTGKKKKILHTCSNSLNVI